MIGVVAVVVAGLITGWRFLLIAPVVYLVSLKNRDAGLLLYALLALYSGSRVNVPSLFTYDEFVSALIFALSLLLLLDDCLSGLQFDKFDGIVGLFLILGLRFPEAFLAGAVFYLAVRLRFDIKVIALTISMLGVFVILKVLLPEVGSTYGQVGVMAGFAVLVLMLTLAGRNVKKVEMF